MKLRFKIASVLFVALAFTWVLPPNIITDAIVARAFPQTEQADLGQMAGEDSVRTAKNPDVEIPLDEYELDTSNIVGEIVEGREKYVKRFRLADGVNQAVVYDSAVHYPKEDGTWAEVDNTLVQALSKDGNSVVRTKDNGYMDVSFGTRASADKLVSLRKGKHEISWKIAGDQKQVQAQALTASTLEIKNELAQKKEAAQGNEKVRIAEKSKSHVRYPSVFSNVDIDYIVEAQRVKEILTISSYTPGFSVSFDIAANGLTTKKLEGGVTAFCDGDTEVFYLMPSYVVDSADSEGKLTTSLEPIESGYRLTLSPDDKWMSTAAYPVTLDPQVDVDWSASNIHDTYISSNYENGVDNDGTNGDWYANASLRIGYQTPDYGTLYGLVKYTNLPELQPSEAVVGAYMITEREDNYSGDYQFTMHRITSSWSQTAVTWLTKPTFSTTVEETHVMSNTNGPIGYFYTWDITDAMRGWYTGAYTNYGLLIKGVSSTAGYRRLFSANATYVDDAVKTIIQYVNTAGLEGSWSYQSMDARRAGTASVNMFTGNLVVSHSDIGVGGNRMPVSISHVHNAVDRSNASVGYGLGWRLNYAQTIASQTISGTLYYKYTDEDGTVHYFRQKDSGYDDESGQNRVLTIDTASTVARYKISDKKDNVLTFDSTGRLVKISDAVGNNIAIAYSGTSARITTITDGASRVYTFAYNATYDLSSITDPGGRVISYTYDSGRRLKTVTYPDDKITTYTYNTTGTSTSYNAITEMRNFDDYRLSVTYASNSFMGPKVDTINEYADTVQGGSQTFTYYAKQTKVVDHLGNVNYYQFNQYGNTICILDDEGRAVYAQYYNPSSIVSGTMPYGQNKMSLSSRLQEPVINLLKNHNLESASYWTKTESNGGVSTISNADKYIGAYSAYCNNPDSTATSGYYQFFTAVKGATYTFSAWVKTISAADTGARLQYSYVNSAGTRVYTSSADTVTGTSGQWVRVSMTFTIPSDASDTSVQVILRLSGAGKAYFDAAQVERQPAANRYNLVQNGDMTYVTDGVPDFWLKNSQCTSADVSTTTADTGRGLLDDDVFKIDGSGTASKSLYQEIAVSGDATTTLTFGGWGKASSVPLGTTKPVDTSASTYNRQFGVYIKVYNGDTLVAQKIASFNHFYRSGWQYTTSVCQPGAAFDSVQVILLYYNNENLAYFDGIQVYKEEFGQAYSYDAKGNLITAKDLSGESNGTTYNADDEPTSLQPPDCTGSEKHTYIYYTGTKKHLVKSTTTVMYVDTEYEYDAYGNVTSTSVQSTLGDTPDYYIKNSATYTNGNYIKKSIDPRGGETVYNYDANFGVNKSTTDPMGQTAYYTYDGDNTAIKMGKLTRVTSTFGGVTYANYYAYTDDFLTKITHNGFDYNIAHNGFGQTTSVKVGSQALVTNTYKTSDRSYLLDYMTYGNGDKVDYTYDSRYRVSAIAYDGEASPRYRYTYAANGQLGSVKDSQNGLTTNIYYDLADRPMKTVESYSGLTRSFQYKYDIDNCLLEFLEMFDGTNYKTNLTYDKDNRITKVNYGNAAGSENVRYTYDGLNRLTTKTLETGTTDCDITYGYLTGLGTNARTSMISSINYGGNTPSRLAYTYNANGQIASVNDGTDTIYYTYDGLGQLTRTDDPTDTRGGANGSTWTYAYNVGGNLTKKTLYAYCHEDANPAVNTAVDTITYSYDATWKDKMVSYDGKAITYDTIGNPLAYDGWSYTWEAGRQLKQMSDGTTTLQFKYNDAGLRTQKINGTFVTKYYWTGTNISHITKGSKEMHFWYDAAGRPTMITYDGTKYYYKLNQQGDVIGLMSAWGTPVVTYTYDSWGKALSRTGTLADTLGVDNPLRYRGYIVDNETGLYYLQSRYYNPEWGRFISSDRIVGSIGSLLGTNLYAYCNNHPIGLDDKMGLCASSSCPLSRYYPAMNPSPCPYCDDITKEFDSQMATNAKKAKAKVDVKSTWVDKQRAFASITRDNAEFDIKRTMKWSKSKYYYRGIVCDPQDLGNINFGYIGKACAETNNELLLGSSLNALYNAYARLITDVVVKGRKNNGKFINDIDNEFNRDQPMIQIGIDVFTSSK